MSSTPGTREDKHGGPRATLDATQYEESNVLMCAYPSEAASLLQKDISCSKKPDFALELDHEVKSSQVRAHLSENDTYLQQAVRAYADNYVLLAVTAAILISTNAACLKILSIKASVYEILAVRAAFSVLVLVFVSRVIGFSLLGPRSKFILIHMRGIFGAGSLLCLATATSILPLSEASFMTNSYPVVTTFLAWLFGFEQIGGASWLGVCGCLLGNALVAHPPFLFGGHQDWGRRRVVGLLLGGTSNIALAITFIVIMVLRKSVPNLTLTFYMHAYTVVGCLPFLLAEYPKPMSTQYSAFELSLYLFAILSAIPLQVLLTRASEIGPPSKVTSILMTNMLLSGFVGMVALSESTTWSAVAGSALIAGSVLLVATQRDKQTGLNKV